MNGNVAILLFYYFVVIVDGAKRNYVYQNFPNLPEIVTNKVRTFNEVYHYPKPNPPLSFDDTTVPEEELPNTSTYIPPLKPPFQFDPNTNQQIHLGKLQVKLLNMSCLDSGRASFFKATFRTDRPLESLPVFDDSGANVDCLKGSGDLFHIDLERERVTQCAVRRCLDGTLCVKLRVATVKGLKLPEDSLVVLACRTLDSVATHVKSLKFNTRTIQGRTLGTVAAGGSQLKLETQVSLYRKTPGSNDFTQVVTPGSAVRLGEDLLLRTAVRDGDGWRYSRMTNVIVRRISNEFGATDANAKSEDSLILVDDYGCRIPAMETICPQEPRQINALVTDFPLRAFMFQKSSPGDEMLLSVNIRGCVRYEDCHQAHKCEEQIEDRPPRAKRETKRPPERDNITDWQSYLEFRVVLPRRSENSDDMENFHASQSFLNSINLFCVVGAVLAVLFALIVAFKRGN